MFHTTWVLKSHRSERYNQVDDLHHSSSDQISLETFQLESNFSQAENIIFIYTYDSPSQNKLRDLARSSWIPAILRNNRFRVIFFVGADGRTICNNVPVNDPYWIMSEEQRVYKDIVFLHHQESYQGLSEKMVKTYEWLDGYCNLLFPKVNWFFKVDTDAYIYAPEFIKLADDVGQIPARMTMVGNTIKKATVQRKGSWANHEYELDTYPTYMAGAGYWISRDLVQWIGWNGKNGLLKTMPNEDALLGIWFAGLKVQFLIDRRIAALGGDHEMKMDAIPRRGCYPKAVYHNLNMNGLVNTHKRVLSCNNPCVPCRQ
jgi:hypothetical protein